MSDIRTADGWWDNLPPDRRIQIWQWVAGRTVAEHPAVEGQFEFPILTPKTEHRASRR
ncbi:MAG: hypothetical protein WBD41_03865 [Rhodococcus sp. (in: high G+C Gram-positive bacteria)]